MPGPVRSLPPPTKKRKVQADSAFSQSIQRLEAELTQAISAGASLNPLADLVELALATKNPQETSKAIYALYRVFVLVISSDKLGLGGDDAAKVVKAWLWDRLNVYVDYLGGLLKDEEKTLRISALQILFSLQKHLSTSYTKTTPSQPQFHISHFRKIVSFLLLCPPSSRPQETPTSDTTIDPDVLHQFHETWFSVHDDVRWFFLRDAATLLNSTPAKSAPSLAPNLLSVLERLNTFPTEKSELNSWWVSEMGTKPPKPKRPSKKGGEDAASSSEDEDADEKNEEDEDDWRKFFDEEPEAKDKDGKPQGPSARLHKLTIHQSLHSLPSHRAVFTRAWLALLPRLSIEGGDGKALAMRALNVMHRGVMPHLTRAVLVMDWVGASVDYGGAVGLLALNALFVLMKEYNLDYPSFYTRLYAFLDRDVLHLKHRARFFRMTELFLSSTHLPANLLASFIKRLSRLALNAPPAAIVMVVPFTYNVLKRHPALMHMIHRTDVDDPSNDPYLPDEKNPLHTQAQHSSLWELLSHRAHYHSGVSTLVKIFSEAFTKPGYAMEDFLDHTYGTLFETEANRKIKKEPALAVGVEKVRELFPVAGAAGEEEEEGVRVESDVVNELWVFA
ncbi:putative CBF/Mak21 family protein [Lyophyllum shimeji]|uniref:CBF/Mak21 family protein n=1 Tax=Lyophyllum shimeji TaxID=47721 RepID=A0A9P3PY33_LYOSH|nr:putative CBF/Mak21 family protein [Lyophyllum shimeji]